MNRRPSLSVVIPAFNEEARLGGTLQRIVAYLDARGQEFEILVIDDGSSDKTARTADEFASRCSRRVRVFSNACNRGKGYSVRRGMLLSRGDYGLLSDSDLSTPIEEISKLEERMARRGLAIAIGSRDTQGAQVEVRQSRRREISGKAFNRMMRLVTGLPFSDTQCGFKLFDLRLTRRLFELQQIEGFGFDVEILYLAVKNGLKVEEVPVVWRNAEGSKVSLASGLAAFVDLIAIRRNDRRGIYDQSLQESPPA